MACGDRLAVVVAVLIGMVSYWASDYRHRLYRIDFPAGSHMDEAAAVDISRRALLLAGREITGLTPEAEEGTNTFVRMPGTNSGVVIWADKRSSRWFAVALTSWDTNVWCSVNGDSRWK